MKGAVLMSDDMVWAVWVGHGCGLEEGLRSILIMSNSNPAELGHLKGSGQQGGDGILSVGGATSANAGVVLACVGEEGLESRAGVRP